MDIIPDMLGEAEFSVMKDSDYLVLSGVLDDTLAKYIKDYTKNPNANPAIVESIKRNLSDVIDSLTFHFELQEMGILDLVASLTPETLLVTNADFQDIRVKLKFLEDNYHKLRMVIPARTKAAYSDFCTMLSTLLVREHEQGIEPTYINIKQRLESNKYVFYVPNAKEHTTGCNIINSRKRNWTMCLRGLEFDAHCKEHNVNVFKRRIF